MLESRKKDFNHKMIFLNQKNEFREYNTFFPLYYDDTDEELKEFLCNLGGNVEEELISKYKTQLDLYRRALEEALRRKVDKTYIYSVYLGKILKIG